MTYIGNNGAASVGNSSETPLASGGTFTGTGEQNFFSHVGVMCFADNSGTLYFDFSNDGTNWDSTFPVNGFSVTASVAEFHTAVKMGRYFRVRLINDSGAQSILRLGTYYGNSFIPSSLPLNQNVGLDNDAILTRSTIPEDEIQLGRRSGITAWHKFGYRDNLTAASGEETVWNATGNFTPLTSAETFDITYTNTSDGAGGSATGATQLTFFYIDSNGLPAVAAHTLGSSGSDTTSFSGLGINRVAVSAVNTASYNVAAITITASSSATTQAYIAAEEGVTQQCIFFNGSNHKGILKSLYFNVNKLSGSSPKVVIKGYVYNRAIGVRFLIFRHTIDTSVENTLTFNDSIGFRLNETDTLYFVADTDTNNTVATMRFSLDEYQND